MVLAGGYTGLDLPSATDREEVELRGRGNRRPSIAGGAVALDKSQEVATVGLREELEFERLAGLQNQLQNPAGSEPRQGVD